MGFSFKKLAEQAVAQLNPFDGGKTASTVRQKQQAQPAVTQRSNQPSYGGGITGVTNWARDKVDANTPQDRWKRQQQKRPELDFTVQDDIRQKLNQVKQTASDVNNTANQVANKYVAPVAKIATSPIAANIDGGKALVGQLTGNQQARNNALGQLKNNSLAVPKVAYNTLIDPAVKTGQAIGENAATAFSGDARRAEQAQTLLTDQLESQKLNAYKQARQGFQDQGQVDRFNKYADSLWNYAGQARTDQINAQQEKYNKIDPVKNTALIADAGLTAASFGVAGVTKAGMKAAATKVTESAVSKGISKDVAMGLGQKAARSNLIKNTLGTGAMGAVQGGVSPYITKEPGTVTGKDVMGGALLGGTMGSVLPATFAKMGGGNLNLRPQLRATADEVLALSNFRSQMGGMIEPDVYSKGVAVAQKYGIDHGTPRGVDEIDNIIGSHRTFVNNQPPARAGLLQPMGQQGGVPNPLQAFDKLKNKLNGSALDTTVKPATPENVYGVNALEKLGKKLKMNQGGYIEVGPGGKKSVADTQLVGLKGKQLYNATRKMLKDRQGQTVTFPDGSKAVINSRTTNEILNGIRKNQFTDTEYQDLLRSLGNFDEHIAISGEPRTMPNLKENPPAYQKEGFDYRPVNYEVNGRNYSQELNVAKGENQDLVYQYTKPNKNNHLGGGVTDKSAPTYKNKGDYVNSIVQKAKKVNSSFRLDQRGGAIADLPNPLPKNQGGFAKLPGKGAPIEKTNVLRDVPIADFKKTDITSWNEAVQNVSKGKFSKTNGPAEVVLTNNGYKLVEGNHRAVQALNKGDATIKAKVISKEGLDEIAKRDGPHIKMGMQDAYTQKQLDAHFSKSAAPIEKTITPENLTVVKEYSQMLKSMDDGARGGQMVGNYSDGYKRVTEHSKFYSDYFAKNKRAPSNKAYEEEALRQLKNGQADSYAQKTFDDLQDPEFRSLASEVEKGSLGKQPLGETFDIPQTATVKTGVKPKTKTNFSKDLPEYDTKKVGLLDKAFRSTRSIIERQGESGKELAGLLQKQRDSKELWAREIEKRLRTVQKLKDKEFENFVEATQGKENPMNDKVVKAIEDWKSVHPHIRQRGVDAGLEIGDLGDNYYPHFIDYDKIYKDKNTYNQAINHLVNTGQADTKEKAIELLGFARDTSRNREFGSLEASRIVDLPFYDKTKASLASYIQGSTDRITKTETFGKSDENALKLIKKIAVEGGDTEAAKNAYDIAVGAKNYNHTASKISSGIRHYTTVTRLGLGALTNVSQSVNTGIVTGHLRTMGAMLKQLDPKTRQFAEDTGVISDAILNDLRRGFGQETFGSSKVGKAVNVITAPGFKQIESFNRRVAATAGKDYALRLAQKGDDKSINILREKLGVTGEIDGTLSERQQIQAARKIVEKTQFKVDAQDLPGWTASPGGKLVAQFRTFSYSQGKFFSNEILKPASKGNFMPLGRLMAALPVGYGLYETRRMIDGRPEEENKMKRGLSAFQKVGGAGLAMDAYFALNPLNSKYLPSDRRVSMAGSFLGGPSVGTAMNAVGSLSDMVQRKNSPTDQSRLEGKVALGNNGDTYTDATSFARFGMQQIPIVGSPIMNRVLPYKKSSEADAGKLTQTASSSGTAVKDLKEAKAITKSGYGKEWAKLSEDDIKNKAIEGDEQAQQVYDSLKAMEKVYAPKNVPTKGLSQSAEDILNKSKKFTESGKKAWGSKETANTEAKTAIKTWAGEDIPVTNEIAVEWAKFEKKRLEGKISDLEMNKEKKSVLKKAYSSTLSEDEKGYYNVSDTDILSGLDQGLVTTESLKKAMDVDAKLVAKGLITKSGFGVKVWNALGLAQPKTGGGSGKVAKGSKGRKSGGKSGKTASRFKYDLYGFGASPTSTSKRLRQLVEEASKSSKKA